MIEKMKTVTVVCVNEDRGRTIDQLAGLGVVHVTDVATPQSAELEELTAEREAARRAAALLAATEPAAEEDVATWEAGGEKLAERIMELQEAMRLADDEERHWRDCLEQLAPWGSFSRETIRRIEEGGYEVRLCVGNEKSLPGNVPEGGVMEVVSVRHKQAYYVLVHPAGAEVGEEHEGVFVPPETDVETVRRKIAEAGRRQAEAVAELSRLTRCHDQLEAHIDALEARIGQVRARDGMGDGGRIAYLQGYVPQRRLGDLSAAAGENGWALIDDDVDARDDSVPTLLRVPKWLQVSKPIFEFIGILPGYREADVSGSVLVFLTLFFGIIIGDAGYGAIFLAAGVAARLRVKTAGGRRAANLFLLMSGVTVAWGGLSGNWFAIPRELLPQPMRGIDWLTDGTMKDKHVQWLCFLIAAVHLSLARLWQALLHINSRQALGHLGWALLLWGNFFTAVELIVYPGSFPQLAYGLYGVGVLLVLGCGVHWTDIGDVLNLPFGFINSFVDVLSYIRLFAVGLSTYFIAASFNDMGGMVFDVSPWLLVPAAVVILFGHLLNIALGFMGVLVHGIRLNTLEFSNHMGLSWSGRPYDPLRKAPEPQAAVAE
jgi:V/A-type H+-transporting ATPase subunit I